MNTFDAAVTPVDFRNATVVGGAASHVGLEVLVSYLARRVFGIEKRTILELTAIHGISVPLAGGLSGFADSAHPLRLQAPMGDQFMDGAKGIPGVFAATYIVNTFLSGIHAPGINVKDILVTAASKILTRPLMSMLYPNLGDSFRNGQDAIEETFQKQREQSALRTAKETEEDERRRR